MFPKLESVTGCFSCNSPQYDVFKTNPCLLKTNKLSSQIMHLSLNNKSKFCCPYLKWQFSLYRHHFHATVIRRTSPKLRNKSTFWFQVSAAMLMKSALFWGITLRRVVIVYRRFGTTYRSHPHGSRGSFYIPPFRHPNAAISLKPFFFFSHDFSFGLLFYYSLCLSL
jgi:hypothetical protein